MALNDLVSSLGGSSNVLGSFGVIGLGAEAYGEITSYNAARAQSAANLNIANLQQQQDYVRQQAMEVSARRNQMEVYRNQQRARSLALASATSQGAQFGSGLSGGYGQIAGQAGVNALGIAQNFESGSQMFSLTNAENYQKILASQAGTTMATGQGVSQFGGSILGSLGGAKSILGV